MLVSIYNVITLYIVWLNTCDECSHILVVCFQNITHCGNHDRTATKKRADGCMASSITITEMTFPLDYDHFIHIAIASRICPIKEINDHQPQLNLAHVGFFCSFQIQIHMHTTTCFQCYTR